MVESLRVVTPTGTIENRRLPASGAGPNPDRAFIGSLWEYMRGRAPVGAMALADFKQQLVAAHRAGLLRITRADLVGAMDPAEVELSGPAEARFEDPETREAVVLRPRDWAEAYQATVTGVVSAWRRECRRRGIGYARITTDTPFGVSLRSALVQGARLT